MHARALLRQKSQSDLDAEAFDADAKKKSKKEKMEQQQQKRYSKLMRIEGVRIRRLVEERKILPKVRNNA